MTTPLQEASEGDNPISKPKKQTIAETIESKLVPEIIKDDLFMEMDLKDRSASLAYYVKAAMIVKMVMGTIYFIFGLVIVVGSLFSADKLYFLSVGVLGGLMHMAGGLLGLVAFRR